MKLKKNKKASNLNLPLPPVALAALGVGLAALAGLAALLLNRNRREKAASVAGEAASSVGTIAQQAADSAKGAAHEATAPVRHSGREYDDVTLARKVESEVLGDEDAPKGSVVVNARDGVVELRGEVKRPEDVKALGAAAAKVAGVKDVNNLLHTPGSEPKTSPVSDPDEVRERAKQS
jgi:osmotically-inducible protein OsmY